MNLRGYEFKVWKVLVFLCVQAWLAQKNAMASCKEEMRMEGYSVVSMVCPKTQCT